jgi:hypothetical protein
MLPYKPRAEAAPRDIVSWCSKVRLLVGHVSKSPAMPRTTRRTATLTALQRLTRRQNMRRSIVTCGVVALALAASVLGLTGAKGASERRASAVSGMPIVVRCPRASDRRESGFPTADHVIVVARRVNAREVTHYQGQAVRRTATNTPVEGLVMFLNDDTLDVPGRQALAARARKRCGTLGLASSAVTFYDSLSPVCCQTFTLFVTKGRRAWIVFRA